MTRLDTCSHLFPAIPLFLCEPSPGFSRAEHDGGVAAGVGRFSRSTGDARLSLPPRSESVVAIATRTLRPDIIPGLERPGCIQSVASATKRGVAAGELGGWARPVSQRLTAQQAAKPREMSKLETA